VVYVTNPLGKHMYSCNTWYTTCEYSVSNMRCNLLVTKRLHDLQAHSIVSPSALLSLFVWKHMKRELFLQPSNEFDLQSIVNLLPCLLCYMYHGNSAWFIIYIYLQVVRLLYTNSGLAVLALASNAMHKLWKWQRTERNPHGKVQISLSCRT